MIVWRAASSVIRHQSYSPPRPVEVTRVIVDTRGHKVEKVVTRKEVEKRVAQVHKEIEKHRPTPSPHPVRLAQAEKPPAPKQVASLPRPEGAHNHILTAIDNGSAPKPDEPAALPGGNAAVGKPTDQQNPGNAAANPVVPPAKDPPKVESKVEPKAEPKVEPKVETRVEPKIEPKVEPKVEPKLEPKAEPKVESRPKGPTRDAEPVDQSKPEIPEDLKKQSFKSFVRVKVEIEADGSFAPILRTSSGNAEIDTRVLAALKRWRWKPALKDGIPIKTTQLFKFEFEVE